jgi:uncharacterized protein (TIGR03086 family)
MSGPAEEHRRVADAFTATVEGVGPDGWERPAPVEGWVARDVVRHLVEWFPGFLQGSAGVVLPAGPSVDDDPVGAWCTQTAAVQALLDDPASADREHDLPHIGRMTLAQAIDMIYTSDVFLHRWDLARATGQDETLDPQRCAAMLEGMLPMDEALRQSGHYGPKVPVPDDADAQTKLLAFIGPAGSDRARSAHGTHLHARREAPGDIPVELPRAGVSARPTRVALEQPTARWPRSEARGCRPRHEGASPSRASNDRCRPKSTRRG